MVICCNMVITIRDIEIFNLIVLCVPSYVFKLILDILYYFKVKRCIFKNNTTKT